VKLDANRALAGVRVHAATRRDHLSTRRETAQELNDAGRQGNN
jgi:hypothetical protein